MKSLRPLALGFDLAFANCFASQGPYHPPKWRAFGSSLAQNVLGRGMGGFQGLHRGLSLGKQRSYVGVFLWPWLQGGVHYTLFLEGILMKLCDSEPVHLSETELPSSVNQER